MEFVKPGSETEGEIHRVLVKEMEKRKYRPTDIIEEVRAKGFSKFNMHHHTVLVRERKSKDKQLPFGAYVDIGERDWRWYGSWLKEVIDYCEQNKERFA